MTFSVRMGPDGFVEANDIEVVGRLEGLASPHTILGAICGTFPANLSSLSLFGVWVSSEEHMIIDSLLELTSGTASRESDPEVTELHHRRETMSGAQLWSCPAS